MKETAEEFLVEQITNSTMPVRKAIEQAKEMELTQIVKAYDKGEFNCGVNETSEQYYVKTYK